MSVNVQRRRQMNNHKVRVLSKQDLIMKQLSRFFIKEPKNMGMILPILQGSANISLRIIDWFVTNYAKKNHTQYTLKSGQNFHVYLNYKAQLKAYSKKLFDPFCRKIKKVKGKKIYDGIEFHYDPKEPRKYIETTVGQLNFFKWAIVNEVLEHIIDNLTTIVDDMISDGGKDMKSKNGSKTKKSGKSKKTTTNKDLSISATKTVTKDKVRIIVSFD